MLSEDFEKFYARLHRALRSKDCPDWLRVVFLPELQSLRESCAKTPTAVGTMRKVFMKGNSKRMSQEGQA